MRKISFRTVPIFKKYEIKEELEVMITITGLIVELLGAIILGIGLTGLATRVEWHRDGVTQKKYIYELNGTNWQHALKCGTKKGGIKAKIKAFKCRTIYGGSLVYL